MRAQRLRRKDHDSELVKIAVVAVVLLCALILVAGSPSGALAIAATAGLIWLAQRNSTSPPRRATPQPENDHRWAGP